MPVTEINLSVQGMLSIREVLERNLQIQLTIMLVPRSTCDNCHFSNSLHTSNVVLWLYNVL